jgi:hypothetical protein
MAKQKPVIFLKDWIDIHPYKKAAPSDIYYQDLCNKVFFELENTSEFPFYLSKDEKKYLACFLVCYFEDIISQIGLWQAFTTKHKELYGKYLPFYELDDYYPDEINLEDVCFLIWYHYSMINRDEYFDPQDKNHYQMAIGVYKLFEQEFESAPENLQLKEFLTISEDEENYYQIRDMIDWIFMYSYLFHYNGIEFSEKVEESMKEETDMNEVQLLAVQFEMRESFVNSGRLGLLSLEGKYFLAEILGKDHKLHQDILDIGERKSGIFIFKGNNDQHIILQHIASTKTILVNKKSMNSLTDLVMDKTCLYLSIVKWNGEYWFSGACTKFDYNTNIIKNESPSAKHLFLENNQMENDALANMYQIFLNFNNNSAIAFHQNIDEMQLFIQKYFEFAEKHEQGRSRKRYKDDNTHEDLIKNSISKEFWDTPCLTFYNKKSGIEVLFGNNGIIPDKKNPSFEEVDENDLLDLFLSEDCSADFVKFLIDTYPELQQHEFNYADSKFFFSDTDFLLRFWKKEKYWTKPSLISNNYQPDY